MRVLDRDRDRARAKVHNAIYAGVIQDKPVCLLCNMVPVRRRPRKDKMGRFMAGAWPVEWHHASYLEEHLLHVIPLCRGCHCGVHMRKRRHPMSDPGLMLFANPTASWFPDDAVMDALIPPDDVPTVTS